MQAINKPSDYKSLKVLLDKSVAAQTSLLKDTPLTVPKQSKPRFNDPLMLTVYH